MQPLPILCLAVASTFFPPATLHLIHGLDAPAFRDRERAHASLRKLGPRVVPAMAAVVQTGRMPAEVRRRCEILVRHHESQWRCINPRGWSEPPWIDMLDVERFPKMNVPALFQPRFLPVRDLETPSQVVTYYLNQTWQDDGPDYHRYRSACELYVRDLIHANHTRQAIIGMLESMAPLEAEWRRVYNIEGKGGF